jgi:hypothetical protein
MGGIDNSVAFRDTVWAYNPACDVPGSTCAAWSSLHHLPIANRRSSAAVVNGILYDVGGVNSPTNITNVMRAYTVTTNSWATATSMPTKRLGLGVVNVNGTLYAAGGKKSWVGGATGIMETYNPTSATWTTSTPMSFAHYDLGVGVINGVIYAVGGAKDSSVLNKVEAYAP